MRTIEVSVSTPYAYSAALVLDAFSKKMIEIQMEKLQAIVSDEDKYDYGTKILIQVYNELMYTFDLSIPDEEKRILRQQYDLLIQQQNNILQKNR